MHPPIPSLDFPAPLLQLRTHWKTHNNRLLVFVNLGAAATLDFFTQICPLLLLL